MIKKILPFFLAISCASLSAAGLPATKEALLKDFLTAHEAKSYEQISALINWDGVRKYKKKMIRVYTRNNFGRKVIGTEFEEADTEFLKNFSVGHKKYQSNLPVTHLMRIYFEDTVGDEEPEFGSVVYLVGQHQDGYQIAIATKDPSSPTTSHH